MSTHQSQRPPAAERTPETPAAIARTIAQLAGEPLTSFVAVVNDDTRDAHYQRLQERLIADLPPLQRRDLFSTDRESEVITQLRTSLQTDEYRELLGQLAEHDLRKTIVCENAAFLIGVEVGRQAQRPTPDDGLSPEQRAELARLPAAMRAMLARNDVLARFAEVERFLGFVEGFAMIADASEGDIPINSVGMGFVADAAGGAESTMRKLRREFEAESGGAR